MSSRTEDRLEAHLAASTDRMDIGPQLFEEIELLDKEAKFVAVQQAPPCRDVFAAPRRAFTIHTKEDQQKHGFTIHRTSGPTKTPTCHRIVK